MKKAIYVLAVVVISLVLPEGIILAGDAADHYSNVRVSGETGDCGGFELWLTKSGQSFNGEFAGHEGDCGADKKKIEDVKYDPKTGALSFKATYLSDDFYCTFKGTMKKDRVSGTVRLFQKASREMTYSERVDLLKEE
jgi:hypothetical protein